MKKSNLIFMVSSIVFMAACQIPLTEQQDKPPVSNERPVLEKPSEHDTVAAPSSSPIPTASANPVTAEPEPVVTSTPIPVSTETPFFNGDSQNTTEQPPSTPPLKGRVGNNVTGYVDIAVNIDAPKQEAESE